MQNDEIPVFSTSKVGPGTVAGVGVPPCEDFSGLSLDALLVHKSWKARREGFERVRNDPKALKAHLLEKPKRLMGEINAAAQEALFEALLALVSVCDEEELNVLACEPLKAVIDKGITGRPKAVQTSFKFVSDLVGAAKQTEVFDVLLPVFSHKTPKNRMAAVQLCAHIIGDYGVQGLPMKSILKAMQPLFNDSSAQVRKEAASLCCQCYKFIGAGIKGFLTDIREVQLQELEALFEGVVVGEGPKKTIRGQIFSTPKKPIVPVTNLAHTNGTSNDIDDTAYETHEEVPVLSRLPRNFYKVAMNKGAKWQDRVAMVQDHLLPLIAAPKIRLKDDYHELVSMVREFLIDPQAPLMLLGFKCIQELARALRTGFSTYARSFLGPLFDKMKDKKTSVVEHITTTLETLLRYKCITLEQCQDEIDITTQSRVPNQRLALIHWLLRLTDKLDRIHFNRLSRAQNMLARLMNDEKLEIREASCLLSAKLIALFGEANFQSFLSSLDEKQRTKLATAINAAANIQCTPTCSPAKKTQRVERCEGLIPSVSRTLLIGTMDSSDRSSKSVRGERHSSVMARQLSPDVKKQHVGDDTVSLESTLPTKDEAFKRMLGLIDDETMVGSMLRSKDWNTRYNGVMRVRTMIDGWSEKECTEYLDSVVVYLRVDPGWGESIFQVFQAMLGVLQELISRATTVSPGTSYAIIAGCACRLTEPKNKSAIRDLITLIAKSQGASFVLRHLIEAVISVKTPKLIQECNEYMTQLIQMFPSPPIYAKSVVEYLKTHCFDQPFPALRSSAINLLVTTRLYAGSVVDVYMNNVDTTTRNAYDEGVAQSNGTTGPRRAQSTRIQRSVSCFSPSRSLKVENQQPLLGGSVQQYISVNTTNSQTERYLASSGRRENHPRSFYENEESARRVDISQQLIPLSKQITNAVDWRLRLDAVKKVEELIHANNKSIASNGVTEVLRALRTRFDEVNKNFVIDVLRTVSLVIESAGPIACRPGIKNILQGVLGMLGDQKLNLRDAATKVAYLILKFFGIEHALQCMQKPLTAESHVCNKAALEMIESGFQQEPEAVISKMTVSLLVPAVVRLCMSRILEVRSVAERVIGKFLPIVGHEVVLRAMQSLRPAERQSVMGSIERQVLIFLRNTNPDDEQHQTPTCLSLAPAKSSPSGATHSLLSPSASPRQTGSGTADRSKSHRGIETPLSPHAEHSPITSSKQISTIKDPQSPGSRPSTSQRVRPHTQNEELLSIQEIMVGMRSASSLTATNTCAEFLNRLQNGEDCGTPEIIQIMVERLYDNIKSLDVELALGLISCLKAIFEKPRCAQWCHSSLLFRMLGMIFDCLLSEPFSLQEKVIKALNNMTLKLLEGCPSNDVFSALMSRMTSYSAIYTESTNKKDLKYIQVTVKCLMRLDFEAVLPDNVILCCHEYLLQHPPSVFRNLDDLSIRTVKTILQDLTRRYGAPLLDVANRVVGTQNLVTHFIRACLENQERAIRTNNEGEHKRVIPGATDVLKQSVEQIKQQRITSPSRLGRTRDVYVDPYATPLSAGNITGSRSISTATAMDEKSVVGIFARIRNHVTSSQGIEELYAYLKHHPVSPEFDQQFRRCSEAFRSFIKRKMERQMAEDPEKPSGFILPDILRLTP